jgi:hypothetical protein
MVKPSGGSTPITIASTPTEQLELLPPLLSQSGTAQGKARLYPGDAEHRTLPCHKVLSQKKLLDLHWHQTATCMRVGQIQVWLISWPALE